MGQCEQCKHCGEGAGCSNCPTDESPRDQALGTLVGVCKCGSFAERIDAAATILNYELRICGC